MKRKQIFFILILLSIVPCFIQAQELGDVNGDGDIDIIDALVTAQYYVGLNPDPFFPEAADVTGCDGNIDIIDALVIAQLYVGLINQFPCENITIEYRRSGGFTGITETIIIGIADRSITVNDEKRRLFDIELTGLMKRLHKIDVSNFPHDTAPCCCDRYYHEITLSSTTPSLNGTGEWSDCTEDNHKVPQELLDLAVYIRGLAIPCYITIEYIQSGGFIGTTDTVIIRTADQLITVNDESRELSDNELERLFVMLDTIDVLEFPNDTVPCCCDRYSHEITLLSTMPAFNGTGKWTDCTEENQQVPQELLDLAALIRELANPPGIDVVMSDMSRNMDPHPDAGELDSVVSGNNLFAFDCFHTIKSEEGNIFFSPVSFSFAFAMCYAGANGNTETEIAEVMHFTLPEDNLHNAFNALELTLTSMPEDPPPEDDEEFELYIANSTWGQRNYYFVPAFLDILAYHYGAGMNAVNFIMYPESCRLLINNWVSEQTGERINDLLPFGSIDSLTRLVLTNAIYFKANWLYPFNDSYTEDGPFTLLDGTTVTVPLMYQHIETPYYEVPGEYSAVQLPYRGVKNNSMIIILPDQGQFEAFENSFTNEKLTSIIQAMTDHHIALTMPKFDYEWGADYPFIELLQSLGMRDAFTGSRADFSGINGKTDLFITGVFHKGFIAVDELGTEAAAATAIVIGKSLPPPMTIDRPFLFVIRNDDTGVILFFGRVLAP